jgi:hypothetical protein
MLVIDKNLPASQRRLLRKSKRLGVVARVGAAGVRFWRKGQTHLQRVEWPI